MANKNTKTKSKQKNSAAKTSSAKNTKAVQQQINQKQEDRMRIAGIIVFAFSVIFFFLAVISGDGVWLDVHNAYVGVFGVFAACVFPLISIVVMIFYSFNSSQPAKLIAKSIETVVMVLLIASFVHIVRSQTGEAFEEVIVNCYKEAPTTFNGGFVGAVLGWLLLSMGKAPAII
ncbi:MAG: hypothetical protein K2F67_00175, partial [Eubacterium sp.]|nr:hypothetical protein [Eubacterium sp.]